MSRDRHGASEALIDGRALRLAHGVEAAQAMLYGQASRLIESGLELSLEFHGVTRLDGSGNDDFETELGGTVVLVFECALFDAHGGRIKRN